MSSSFLDFIPIVGDAVNFASGIATNIANRNAQRRQNAFNAAEAEKNRQFQSQEAQMARDWQEQQYLQYSSPQAMVSQYQDAGLNPALMYGSNLQTSTGSSPSPSGSAASGSVSPLSAPSLGNVVQNLLGLMKVKSEIDNMDADSESKRAAAGLSRSAIDLNNQNISESRARVSKLIKETESEELRKGLIAAQQLLAERQSDLAKQQNINLTFQQFELEMRNKFMKDFKTLPSDNLFQSVWNLIFMGKNWIQHFLK